MIFILFVAGILFLLQMSRNHSSVKADTYCVDVILLRLGCRGCFCFWLESCGCKWNLYMLSFFIFLLVYNQKLQTRIAHGRENFLCVWAVKNLILLLCGFYEWTHLFLFVVRFLCKSVFISWVMQKPENMTKRFQLSLLIYSANANHIQC